MSRISAAKRNRREQSSVDRSSEKSRSRGRAYVFIQTKPPSDENENVRPFPVAHMPTVFVILYMCVTSDASINLSCARATSDHTPRVSLPLARAFAGSSAVDPSRGVSSAFAPSRSPTRSFFALAFARFAHRNLLLRHDAHGVFPSHADGGDADGFDRLERVLCASKVVESRSVGEIVSSVNVARRGRGDGARRRRRAREHAPTWYRRPSGENTVMCRSYPAPAPRDIGLGDLTAARCDNRRAAKAGADSDDSKMPSARDRDRVEGARESERCL